MKNSFLMAQVWCLKQIRLVTTRDQFEGTRDKTRSLMRKMEEQPHEWNKGGYLAGERRWSRAGYLFMSDKNFILEKNTISR